jgi:hypothetical protein
VLDIQYKVKEKEKLFLRSYLTEGRNEKWLYRNQGLVGIKTSQCLELQHSDGFYAEIVE